MQKQKIVLAIAGSSGSIYAKVMMDRLVELKDQWEAVGVVMTDNGRYNWELELGNKDYENYPFDFYEKKDWHAPFASGSARYGAMLVCPCSMGLLGRINAGISNDLITRAADVILKERRKLVMIPRETPLSLIHLRNMTSLTEAGAIICPAIPSFYGGATGPEELAATVVDRALELAGIEVSGTYRWG
ncbi:3-octaprenyl-4-hydroxybenzoate carboxy-lyase [Lewinellaceae bacterium SD302]|nr:3-octaprenyl-4-hydroxybenzoate carboxy-lyase [Lewinellaceae bacterium SD302]